MKKMFFILTIIIVLGGSGYFAYKFFSKEEKPPKNIINNNNKEKEKEEPEEIKYIVDPNSNTRPFAIMINCHSESLPQAGLQNAYIVYELMVEAGITRMMALFKDVELQKVGSIRSARTQYLGYVKENDAIYVHAGGAKDALLAINTDKITDIDVDGPYGIRDYSLKRATEHTLFTTTTLLQKYITNNNTKSTTDTKNILTYSSKEIDLSKEDNHIDANNIDIKYSYYRTASYKYDETNKYYLRYMNTNPNNDLVTGDQYHVKNIIVYGVKYTNYTYNKYSGYQKIDNIGSGEGYYITNGYAIPITWEKASEASQTKYKIKATGENLIVNNGNTYIQIYPMSGNLNIR